MNTRFLFIFSGFLSFIFYFIVLFGLVFGFDFSNPIRYITKTDTQLEQSIEIDAIVDTASKGDDALQGGNPLEGTGIKDMFSSISDKASISDDIPDNRDRVAKNLALNKKRQQILEELRNDIENINAKLQTIKNKVIAVTSQTPKPDTSDGVYDEWFSKVYKILYSKWNVSFYQNASVSVLLTITDKGDFNYRILKYSRYDDYNQSVENLLKSLNNQKFPPYPKGKFVNIEVNFRTEGK
ncbi:TonB C-terminal domain-containing protein [Helicobacter sp. 11S03491-1]|uniref:energy transducer TonB n=1 Tax=Helicobacter sp. 11S03491-1 TaxID=1476196 RepID=UPI000BA55323|nr:TonB C-terminal domain-containing protein [Helicobacter sp. 11S03491-1]PAF41850.1 hypothetical protein BKH45_05955 [Helicobacter sp. 11S03491-1]